MTYNQTMTSKTQTLKGFRDFLPTKIPKNTRVGVFIDEANLFYIQRELGWKIDWKKFRLLLKKNLIIENLRYYLGMPQSGEPLIKNKKIKIRLESLGYNVITKPLKKIYVDNKKTIFKYKCNFDVEIALDVSQSLDKLDLIIIVSNDSDFIALKNYVLKQKKKFVFICFERKIAWEIRNSKHIFLESFREFLDYNQTKPRHKAGAELPR